MLISLMLARKFPISWIEWFSKSVISQVGPAEDTLLCIYSGPHNQEVNVEARKLFFGVFSLVWMAAIFPSGIQVFYINLYIKVVNASKLGQRPRLLIAVTVTDTMWCQHCYSIGSWTLFEDRTRRQNSNTEINKTIILDPTKRIIMYEFTTIIIFYTQRWSLNLCSIKQQQWRIFSFFHLSAAHSGAQCRSSRCTCALKGAHAE